MDDCIKTQYIIYVAEFVLIPLLGILIWLIRFYFVKFHDYMEKYNNCHAKEALLSKFSTGISKRESPQGTTMESEVESSLQKAKQ